MNHNTILILSQLLKIIIAKKNRRIVQVIIYNYSQTLLTNQSSFAEVLFNDKLDYILNELAWQTVSKHHLFYLHCYE